MGGSNPTNPRYTTETCSGLADVASDSGVARIETGRCGLLLSNCQFSALPISLILGLFHYQATHKCSNKRVCSNA